MLSGIVLSWRAQVAALACAIAALRAADNNIRSAIRWCIRFNPTRVRPAVRAFAGIALLLKNHPSTRRLAQQHRQVEKSNDDEANEDCSSTTPNESTPNPPPPSPLAHLSRGSSITTIQQYGLRPMGLGPADAERPASDGVGRRGPGLHSRVYAVFVQDCAV